LYAELGEIVAGKRPGRENDKERILAINIGLALSDIIVANHIYERAKKNSNNTKWALIS
jgi:ornithine cyclodeaminase/alanine dehydrogenase-like protein (mu-crystallin family)